MALKITKKPTDYISTTAFMYDMAKNSKYFDKSVYEGLAQNSDQDAIQQYLAGLAGAKDKTASDFNQYDYNYLTSAEDKASYALYKLSGETNSELDEYFEYKIQEAIDKETFKSLNVFEKTMSSIGGFIGNALNETLLGTIEGLIDAGAVLTGQKDWAAKDFTGVGAIREDLQKFSKRYTYLDKNKIWSTANDVVTGLAQMAPLLIPFAGKYIYFGAMAGNTAADAVRTNPDIDYLPLLGYTGLVTGVELATEKISGKIFGGTGNAIDNLIFKSSGKGLTKLGQKAAGNWLARVGLNFASEGLEESIAEVADTVLFNALIAQGDEGLRREYSMTDILYAGLIGGLIGGIAEGGRLTTATRYSLTKDGRVVRTKDAKKSGIEISKDFGKLQSVVLSEQLSSAKGLAQTNAITDLIGKYKGKYTAEQLAELHPEEYKKAVEKNKKIQERQTEVILGLNRIFELAGVEGFNRATDLYNSVFETQQRLLSKYVARATGTTAENRAVETEFAIKNPGASIKISDSLTAEQTRFKQNFKNKFGINAYFGDLGTVNGENRKFGLTLNENTIVIDEKQFGKLSEQAVLDQIVKEELVHALQFTKGIITPKVLFAIHKALRGTEVNAQELDPAYAEDTALTKLSEAQAKAIAQVLIFDDLTVSKMFYSEYSTLNKVYNFFRNIRNKLETSNKDLRTEKGKLKYNTLLKRMKTYRDIAAKKLGTIENVQQFIEEFHLTELEQKQLKDAYLENPNVGPISGAETIAFSQEKTPDELFDEKLKTIQNKEKELDSQILGFLNEYLSDEKILVSKQNDTYYAFQAYQDKRKRPAKLFEVSSIQDVVSNLKESGLIDDAVTTQIDAMYEGEAIETTTKTTETGQERIVFGGEYIDDTTKLAESPVTDKQIPKKHKNKSTFKYSTTSIFDYIDEDLSPEQRAQTIEKAVQQENDALDILENQDKKVSKAKAEGILSLCEDLLPSEYQGDIENHKFVSWSNDVYDEHSDVFADLTFEDFVALKNYFLVRIGSDPKFGTAANALIRYGYLQRNDQFKAHKEFMQTLYAQHVSFGAQTISLTSSDYETSLKNFLRQLATEQGIDDIPIDKKFFKMLLPDDVSVEQFQEQLDAEIETLKKQRKDAKDPLDKIDLSRQIAYKEGMKNMLADGDIAAAIDYRIKEMIESGENITDALEKQSIVYNAIIEELITHADFNELGKFQYSSKKVPLSKNMDKIKRFFMGLESFRYLMMLSNPATAIKNFASNTLVFGQAFIEDGVLKLYEKSNVMSEATQGRYTGNYDKNFKDYVKETYFKQIKNHAKGDKWTSTELERLQQQYAEAKDPLKKSKLLSKLQKLEKKMLSDALFTSQRTLLNLTNTLAGSSDIILSQSMDFLKAKYHPKDVKWSSFDKSEAGIKAMQEKLIETVNKTNPEVAELLKSAISGDKVSTLKLAQKLKLDLVSADLSNPNTIYYNAFKRANKLFFKVDGTMTKLLRNLNKTHPAAAYVVRHLIPFVRVAAGTTSYILDRSPVGLVKGIVGMLKTKHKWAYQMRNEIDKFYKQKFMEKMGDGYKFDQKDYTEYLQNLNGKGADQVRQALAGDDKVTRILFKQMVDDAKIPSENIGSDNLFARAEVMENLAHGTVGTSLMVLGLLLGSLLDIEYDEEDYLGPVIKLGNVKIGLDEVSPFTTLFTMGAMLTSGKIDDKFDAMFKVFADATILSTFDSALSYSDGVWDYAKNQSINIATQYLPAFTKAIAKIGWNKKKDKGSSYGKKLLNSILSNTIAFNWLVPNKIDPYTGEPEKYYDSGWLEALGDWILPVGLRVADKSDFEIEAAALGAETTGMSGSFTINDTDYKLTGKDKEKYAKYKAKYINNRFDNIVNGSEKVTIKDKKTGKYKTVKYSSLTNEEKQRVLKNLYTTGTTVTKIQYWLDKGNSYVVTDRDQYYDYKKLFGNSAKIVYKNKWSTSKFVED